MTDATVKPQPLVTDVPTFLEDLVLHQAARSWQEHRAGNWPAGEHRERGILLWDRDGNPATAG